MPVAPSPVTAFSQTPAAPRRSSAALWFLRVIGVAAVLAVMAPILVVVLSWSSSQTEVWQHLIATQLGSLLFNTLLLLAGVGLLVSILGIGLAWFTVMCELVRVAVDAADGGARLRNGLCYSQGV